ncbi:hypothetical protein CHLRE_04g225776v5 [Chlamydomonas reinhardtii]|uniref:Uncharacterized protein n=1 Tax=Chlamydomonas reinhardtii TaxID=3055 RepID=A0A2K3DUJ9_CHLRE|nr:uncharacterized protein CHLRE_04g225776v5 [Chlamydomonas reinhardtii]PNW84220.1 hypothetical protein CHLRE_04g225776v5 [Chlamydomonas reinhardtii]
MSKPLSALGCGAHRLGRRLIRVCGPLIQLGGPSLGRSSQQLRAAETARVIPLQQL